MLCLVLMQLLVVVLRRNPVRRLDESVLRPRLLQHCCARQHHWRKQRAELSRLLGYKPRAGTIHDSQGYWERVTWRRGIDEQWWGGHCALNCCYFCGYDRHVEDEWSRRCRELGC